MLSPSLLVLCEQLAVLDAYSKFGYCRCRWVHCLCMLLPVLCDMTAEHVPMLWMYRA